MNSDPQPTGPVNSREGQVPPGGPVPPDRRTGPDVHVPVIDLAAARTRAGRLAVARAIGDACERSGFFIVVGHGVPGLLVDRAHALTREFFQASASQKARASGGPGACGFRPSAGSAARSMGADAPPDLCEIFTANVLGDHDAGVRARYGGESAPWARANVWPREPDGFRDAWLAYMGAMEWLGKELMRLFALALGLEESYFDDKVDRHVSTVVANFYFPQATPPLPGQLRKGAHTDWGTLTVLHQEEAGGLQVRDGEGGWRDVPPVPGGFVVNIGDMMAFWTGGRWVSTLHRVVNPVRDHMRSRLSLPFFYVPNHDAVVEPLARPGTAPARTRATTPGEWYRDKMAATFS